MNYLVFKHPAAPLPQLVMFAGELKHADIAAAFAPLGWEPTSAGAVEWTPRAFGAAESLGLAPAEGDTELLATLAGAAVRSARTAADIERWIQSQLQPELPLAATPGVAGNAAALRSGAELAECLAAPSPSPGTGGAP